MKYLKLLFFLLISLFFSCKSINKYSYLGSSKNVNTVKKIIDNYMNLETYLNNKIISDTFLLKSSFKYEIPTLKEHIIKNKFNEDYKFETKDSIEKIFILTQEKCLYDSNSYVILNLIKIRSQYNNDIIWFIFKYYKDEMKWKFLNAEYCNNYNERALGEVDSCDKK